MARLVTAGGRYAGRQYQLDRDELVLGRHSDCDIVIAADGASRKHARILRQGDNFLIEDLGSTNGTFVNAQRVGKAVLKDADTIKMGTAIFTFFLSDVRKKVDGSQGVLSMRPAASDKTSILDSIDARSYDITAEAPALGPEEQLKRVSNRLKIVNKINEAISGSLNLDSILKMILDDLFSVYVQAERGFILLLDDDAGAPVPKAVKHRHRPKDETITLSSTIINHAIDNQKALLSVDASSDQKFAGAMSIADHDIHSVMCAPLIFKERILGIIYIDTTNPKAEFTADDLSLLTAIGLQTAVAINTASQHQALIKSERLATVGQAIASMAHCVKNVLNGLQAGSYMLDQNLPREDSTSPLARGWSILKRNMQFLSNIVLDMLSYSKERKPLCSPCNISDLCDDTLTLLQQQADSKNVKLTCNLSTELTDVCIDESQVKRCLINLVGNAIDACEKDTGEVRIETAPAKVPGFFVVRVSDNGCGMEPASREKIFDPFFSTKGGKGTGLGLPVTKKIVEEHGGTIHVTSTIGVGTEFVIELPVEPREKKSD